METRQASALRTFERLSESDQEDVNWMANSVLSIWPRPELSGDAKLYFIDDVALIFQKFGKALVQESIDHFRQHQETHSRPTVRALRDRCSERRGSKKSAISPEMQDYYRDLAQHPEEFIPLALIVRDTLERVKRKREGKPFTASEIHAQTEASWAEWRAMVREGKHKEAQQAPLSFAMRGVGQ